MSPNSCVLGDKFIPFNSKNMITSTLKNDIPAGIVVFLVALPLCLGVALASGAPLFSGVISGIVGGIVVGILSKSQTSVSGPAAGLAAVVLASITQLGSFDVFLTAVLLAGVLQLGFGLLKGGFVASYVPSNVIKGLLASIGILLILKQIPHAIGYDKDAEGDFAFFQPDGENTFSELYQMLDFINLGAVVISIVSLFILIGWDKTPLKKFKFFPSSLFVVLLGVVLNELFCAYVPGLCIEQSHLVNLPRIDTSDLASYLHFPKLSHLSDYRVYTTAVTIAIVATLETLLNIEAVDKLDPHKRESPPDSELVAQGIGNMLAGLLGGIPITSVIVRSSVNINAGNKTKLSAVFHGIFMLASVLVLSPVLNKIPLASLAAILLMTGYKLAKVSLFRSMYQKGWSQFIPFMATILAIVFTDLLIGVLIGLAISIFYLLRSNYENPFTQTLERTPAGKVIKFELSEEVSFLNKAAIKSTLWRLPKFSKVVIDATHSKYIDPDVLEILDDYQTTFAPENNITLSISGLPLKH
jgi:carbonic anhydrase